MAKALLTKREIEVLRLICNGHTDREIADLLDITYHTADSHRKNMLKKLRLKNTALLVRFAVENCLLTSTLPKPNDLKELAAYRNGSAAQQAEGNTG